MFVMTHDEIYHVLAAGKKFTYGNPVVDYWPQKEDLHRIRITAGGNLINMHPALQSGQQIWTRQNYIGIVSYAQKGQSICV
jgi:hypothetical protein